MKIVIPEVLIDEPLQRLRARHDVVYDPTLVERPAELLEAARDADALVIRVRTQMRGELLESLTRCKVIGRQGVGLDNIDVERCRERGIRIIPAIGANARSVAEYVMTTAMMMLRGAYLSSAEVAAGKWPRAPMLLGREIWGRTLGLVGFGSIGQVTARLAKAMGMEVLAHDPSLEPASPVLAEFGCRLLPLDDLLAASDVVSLHLPLVPGTRRLFDAARLACMKPGSVLVNAARGGIVDEAALADALRRGRPYAAAIDVFESEPLGPGSPLADAPNLLLTPHIGGLTADSEIRVSNLVVDRVLEVLAQHPET